jgi:hypothetical protein
LHPDGYGEFSKGKGWEHLWSVAATAPLPIAHRIATKGAVAGKFWKLKLKLEAFLRSSKLLIVWLPGRIRTADQRINSQLLRIFWI